MKCESPYALIHLNKVFTFKYNSEGRGFRGKVQIALNVTSHFNA